MTPRHPPEPTQPWRRPGFWPSVGIALAVTLGAGFLTGAVFASILIAVVVVSVIVELY